MLRGEFRRDGCMILQRLAEQLAVVGVIRYGFLGGGGERVFYISQGPLDPPLFLADSVVGGALALHRLAGQEGQGTGQGTGQEF
jgi:hypothetical protein